MNEQFISTAEAAKRLKVHQTTVQRWIRQGHLQAKRIGPGRNSPYRVVESSVEQLRKKL